MQTILDKIQKWFGDATTWIEDTVNLITISYVSLYLLGFGLAIWMESWQIAVATAIVCDVLAYVFGARLVLGYGLLKPLVQRLFGVELKSVADVWYWKAFIAMWVTLPLYALAILRPWRIHWTAEVMLALFMLLHIVATQRHFGGFWRKVYAGIMVSVLVVVLFAIAMPQTFYRMGTGYRMTQKGDEIQNSFENDEAVAVDDAWKQVNDQIVTLQKEHYDALRRNASWTSEKKEELLRLEGLQAELKAKHFSLQASASGSALAHITPMFSVFNPSKWDRRTQLVVIVGMVMFGLTAMISMRRQKSQNAGGH